MKLLILFVCLCLFVTNIEAAIARIPNTKNSKYPNKCYYEGPPRILLDLNTKKRVSGGACEVWECLSDYTIYHETCGSVSSSGHCRVIPGDRSGLFPDCCPDIVC